LFCNYSHFWFICKIIIIIKLLWSQAEKSLSALLINIIPHLHMYICIWTHGVSCERFSYNHISHVPRPHNHSLKWTTLSRAPSLTSSMRWTHFPELDTTWLISPHKSGLTNPACWSWCLRHIFSYLETQGWWSEWWLSWRQRYLRLFELAIRVNMVVKQECNTW